MHGIFKQKFWFSLILAIPILLISPMTGITLPFQFMFLGSEWVVFVLATLLFIYGGQPFLSGAKMELTQKKSWDDDFNLDGDHRFLFLQLLCFYCQSVFSSTHHGLFLGIGFSDCDYVTRSLD